MMPDETIPKRSTAVTVGVLFLVATGFYVGGQAVHGPVLGSVDFLQLAYPERGRVLAGLLIELVGILAIPLIALTLYPVLRSQAETAALGYVGLRILEAGALLVVVFNNWALVSFSRSYLEDAGVAVLEWEVAGAALQAVSESAFLVSVAVVFPLSALVLNSVLCRTRLVPRWLSGWGWVAGVILLGGSILEFFELLPAVSAVALEVTLSGPIAVQEMVFAVWLIAKGFQGPKPGAAAT